MSTIPPPGHFKLVWHDLNMRLPLYQRGTLPTELQTKKRSKVSFLTPNLLTWNYCDISQPCSSRMPYFWFKTNRKTRLELVYPDYVWLLLERWSLRWVRNYIFYFVAYPYSLISTPLFTISAFPMVYFKILPVIVQSNEY